jgi:hypothetical protein
VQKNGKEKCGHSEKDGVLKITTLQTQNTCFLNKLLIFYMNCGKTVQFLSLLKQFSYQISQMT